MTRRICGEMEIRRPQPDLEIPALETLSWVKILIDGEVVRCGAAGQFVTEVKGWEGLEGPEITLTHRERMLAFAILTDNLAFEGVVR